MRKLLAITLLAFLGLPFAANALAFAPKSDANLPACCRKGGKHHCAMSGVGTSDISQHVSAQPEACPFAPQAAPASHVTSWVMQREQRFLVLHIQKITIVAQAESKRRISLNRSRQKRGPPAMTRL